MVINATIAAVVSFWNRHAEVFVYVFHQGSGVFWHLKEDKDEQELVDDADGERESPEQRMRSHEGSVGHDRHSGGNPEKRGGKKSATAIILRIVENRFFNHSNINQTAQEKDENGDRVGSPEEADVRIVVVCKRTELSNGFDFQFLNLKLTDSLLVFGPVVSCPEATHRVALLALESDLTFDSVDRAVHHRGHVEPRLVLASITAISTSATASLFSSDLSL